MWHLYLLVFIQTSCVLLRSLHIRKCWRLPSNQLCLILIYISKVLIGGITRSTPGSLACCTWTVVSHCVLYDSEQEVDFTELELLPPPPLYADTFWLPRRVKRGMSAWKHYREEYLPCIRKCFWSSTGKKRHHHEQSCWCDCTIIQIFFFFFVVYIFTLCSTPFFLSLMLLLIEHKLNHCTLSKINGVK